MNRTERNLAVQGYCLSSAEVRQLRWAPSPSHGPLLRTDELLYPVDAARLLVAMAGHANPE